MITYLKGDATCPQAKGHKIIAHVCNDIGKWGKGFVMAVSAKWPEVRDFYLKCYRLGINSSIGNVQFVQAQPYIEIASMIAQHGIKTGSHGPPIRYDALTKCLLLVASEAKYHKASVHMPRIGCGLAGGKWSQVEPIINDIFPDTEVFVYDLGSNGL